MIELSRPDFGDLMNVTTLQRGCKELNPDLHFDPGGNLDLWHPNRDRWLGVYLNERNVASMDRGPWIPEYDITFKPNGRVIKIGWRRTADRLTRHGAFTMEAFLRKFRVDGKPLKAFIPMEEPELKQIILGRG